MMEAFKSLTASMIPVDRDDVGTDQLIPRPAGIAGSRRQGIYTRCWRPRVLQCNVSVPGWYIRGDSYLRLAHRQKG